MIASNAGRRLNDPNLGSEYTPEELAFLRAVEHFKRRERKPFPACSEILRLVRALGYRRVAPAEAPYGQFIHEPTEAV